MFGLKKFYYKEVKCLSCEGTGKVKNVPTKFNMGESDMSTEQAEMLFLFLQGTCLACKGKGIQTVLEYEE